MGWVSPVETPGYRGRFAPSPTGPLHAGSLVAALASWLDARAHGGKWLIRIEDVDQPRTVHGATQRILQQLSDCGLQSDEPVVLQSARSQLYQQALEQLMDLGLAYPCTCSRKDILAALQGAGLHRVRHGELVYPGTCRHAAQTAPIAGKAIAWRVHTDMQYLLARLATATHHPDGAPRSTHATKDNTIHWSDALLGPQQQDVARAVGDFVLKRADGCYTYQLAVVVDDAAQGITHVVRGMDLADNTARQILLQRALGLPTPHYLHTPLVLGANGEKLSKQNGALALDTSSPEQALAELCQAARMLGLPDTQPNSIAAALQSWVPLWLGHYRATAARMERAT